MHRHLKGMSCTLSAALLTQNLPQVFTPEGPLTGGPLCRLASLRNGNVPFRYFLNVVVQCRQSNSRKGRVALSNLRVKGPT